MEGWPRERSMVAVGVSFVLGKSRVFMGAGSAGTVHDTYFFMRALRAWYLGVELPCSFMGAS